MVMAMMPELVRHMNSGENGEAVMADAAYPRITIMPSRLSPAGRSRDEIAACGSDSVSRVCGSAYPDSIPSLAGGYP